MYSLDMAFFLIFSIDENIILIYNDKNIKLFCKNLVNIALKICQNVDQSKKYYLILKMAVSNPENFVLLIFFVNFHPMISTHDVKLDKLPSLPQLV